MDNFLNSIDSDFDDFGNFDEFDEYDNFISEKEEDQIFDAEEKERESWDI